MVTNENNLKLVIGHVTITTLIFLVNIMCISLGTAAKDASSLLLPHGWWFVINNFCLFISLILKYIAQLLHLHLQRSR